MGFKQADSVALFSFGASLVSLLFNSCIFYMEYNKVGGLHSLLKLHYMCAFLTCEKPAGSCVFTTILIAIGRDCTQTVT